MPIYHRTYSPDEPQFITTSTYRSAPVFLSPRFCHYLVERLEEVRQKMHCLLIGWALMPEHFHLLLKPQPAESTPLVVKELKEEAAKRILKALRENLHHPRRRKMLARLRLPPSVHDESHFRLWNRRFQPFNVYTEEKRREKLNYMHNKPVERGLVGSPGDWPWSRRGGEILLPRRRIRPAYGPAGLSGPPERVPSGHRRPQKAGSAPARGGLRVRSAGPVQSVEGRLGHRPRRSSNQLVARRRISLLHAGQQGAVFQSQGGGRTYLWRVNFDGSAPVQISNLEAIGPAISPDGEWIACITEEQYPKLMVLNAGTGALAQTFAFPSEGRLQNKFLHWSPDGLNVVYSWRESGISNLRMQALPGGPPRHVTNFQSGLVWNFDFSRDGKQVVLAQGADTTDVVLIRNSLRK
jgi:REP element-mobilizing transposase RayT